MQILKLITTFRDLETLQGLLLITITNNRARSQHCAGEKLKKSIKINNNSIKINKNPLQLKQIVDIVLYNKHNQIN